AGSGRACKQAQVHGLRCLEGSASLGSLFQTNRPMVLKLRDNDGSDFYVTVTAMQGDTATLVVGAEIRTVDVKEIASRWVGEYTLLWRPPKNYHGEIKPGDRGDEILWLEKQLVRVQGLEVKPRKAAVYDEDLVRRVKEFQRSAGLVPDGIAGARTLIHLSTAVGDGEPALIGGRGN
ncbi:MAG TPA: peptidoglycan-binding domain-containing protein, partial [Thermodesulfovibrionales bacterium]|nr:peptidoglycan-binding domain-containing protein [Thermodesulfovibrionales bacterium]